MPEEVSIWTSWLASSSTFLLFNIGIIITLIYQFSKQKQQNHQDRKIQHHQIFRVPSLLERVRSLNLSNYYHVPEFEDWEVAKNSVDSMPELETEEVEAKVIKNTSESSEARDDLGQKVEADRVDEERCDKLVIVKTLSFDRGDEEGIDAKADEFIKRFKQQLRLQRIDSILRYNKGDAQLIEEDF